MSNFFQDLRYAARQLRHSPGFAVTAIITLALGIGANVVVFSMLNSLVLHPLRLPDANRLYTVTPSAGACGNWGFASPWALRISRC